MGEFVTWFGVLSGLLVVGVGVSFIVRRRVISRRSPGDPRWHMSERMVLVFGVVMIAAGVLAIVGTLL
ncbi:hypothetical protein ACFJGV_10070 [Cnuibacter sp. UC19_7]|uniref:hypothetical protein n=1 Tax=Cnuibacter sp. UC19_7 TaxID=3350166 RepID=UPI00366FFFB2